MTLRRALLSLTILPMLLAGCPSGDDDDSSANTGPTGEAPVIQSAFMCERSGDRDRCEDENMLGALQLAVDLNVTDVDGDLDNPQFFILLNDQTPWLDGRIEDNLGEGANVRINLGCSFYTLGGDLPWRVTMRDAEGNESDEFAGSFSVPLDEPTTEAEGRCPSGL